MSRNFSRRAILGGLLSGAASAAFARAPEVSLRPQLRPDGPRPALANGAEVLIREANLGGRVGCAVVDVKSGKSLEGVNAASGQPPASVTKAVTALYALDALGQHYRFKTRLRATGPVTNGILEGDLVLAGGGDPSLDTDGLAEMAQWLKATGVNEVRGRFLVYGGELPFTLAVDEDQPDHVAYNPSVSGLNLNYNRVHFQWKRGNKDYTVTMDARTAKYRPDVTVARMQVSDRKGPVYTYEDGGSYDSWSVARRFLGKNGSRWLPVRKPEAYAGEVFRTLARSHGIVLAAPEVVRADPGGRALVTRQSEPLPEILREMLKYSTNLTAELVGQMASKARIGQVDSIRASAREMSYWARETLGMKGARLVDHSGLGGMSRLSAEAMARALAAVHKNGQLKPLLKPIALKDANGRRNRNHPVKVAAKTGTLYFVSGLAGYMTATDGTEMAFAIFAADTKRRDALPKKLGDRPPGASGWNSRAKKLQQKLIERWGTVYGS
ncbi:D-alanyl-D-alanine carboxypeptidase/D-alanyl-D-alanine-endopeptidase [Roseovarius sp. CAU 1744]|uniref:D-alanyl-D-alanine carboxypeptidase/D-alanyl-D-alanine endopeptidase n=1 Tax=Roseovarius sp. CAU 1744 TaxID=3140368 RepID=UPI00325B7B85